MIEIFCLRLYSSITLKMNQEQFFTGGGGLSFLHCVFFDVGLIDLWVFCSFDLLIACAGRKASHLAFLPPSQFPVASTRGRLPKHKNVRLHNVCLTHHRRAYVYCVPVVGSEENQQNKKYELVASRIAKPQVRHEKDFSLSVKLTTLTLQMSH